MNDTAIMNVTAALPESVISSSFGIIGNIGKLNGTVSCVGVLDSMTDAVHSVTSSAREALAPSLALHQACTTFSSVANIMSAVTYVQPTICRLTNLDFVYELGRRTAEQHRVTGWNARNRVERRNRLVFLRILMSVMPDDVLADDVENETKFCAIARQRFYLWLRQRLGIPVNRYERRHGIDIRDERQHSHDDALRETLYFYRGKTTPQNTATQLIASATLTPRAPQHYPASGQLLNVGRMAGRTFG